jgi:hypothetical protein
MTSNFGTCIIEAQYKPEPYNVGVKEDAGMLNLLRDNGFEYAEPIGKTYVSIRDTYRTIWECKSYNPAYSFSTPEQVSRGIAG